MTNVNLQRAAQLSCDSVQAEVDRLASIKLALLEEQQKIQETKQGLQEEVDKLASTKAAILEEQVVIQETNQELQEEIDKLVSTKAKIIEEQVGIQETKQGLQKEIDKLVSTKVALLEEQVGIQETKQGLQKEVDKLVSTKVALLEEQRRIQETKKGLQAELDQMVVNREAFLKQFRIEINNNKLECMDAENQKNLMPKSLCFIHTPKSGGTSIDKFFRRVYGQKCSVGGVQDDDLISNHHINMEYVSGHFGYSSYKKHNYEGCFFTTFRHPIPRILSYYQYLRFNIAPRNHWYFGEPQTSFGLTPQELAKKYSFSDFIRLDYNNIRCMIENTQFQQLFDRIGCSRNFSDEEVSIVKKRIDGAWGFYISDSPNNSIDLIQIERGVRLNLEQLNRSIVDSGTIEISKHDKDLLIKMNELDLEIYFYAQELQNKKLREYYKYCK